MQHLPPLDSPPPGSGGKEREAGGGIRGSAWKSLKEERRESGDGFPDFSLNRRSFLGAGAAGLIGLTSCSGRFGKLLPYVQEPEAFVSGNRLTFATAQVIEGLATGLLAESFQGRPIKMEPHPEHPASMGGTSVWNQAYVAEPYLSHRARLVRKEGGVSSWEEFRGAIPLTGPTALLSEITTSPSLRALVGRWKRRDPGLQWVQYEPCYRAYAAEGARIIFGQALETRYQFSEADFLFSFDCDFLATGLHPPAWARQFAARRGWGRRNTLWMAECSPTLTGANADLRLALSPARLEQLALALWKGERPSFLSPSAWEELERQRKRAGSRMLFLAGNHQPPWIHALCLKLNQNAGSIGTTVELQEPLRPEKEPLCSRGIPALENLAARMREGKVHNLVILGGNPAWKSPVDLEIPFAFGNVKNIIYLNSEEDETSALCRWFLPASHPLECWGDALAFDGTRTVLQPLADPFFPTKSPLELISLLLGEEGSGRDLVRAQGPGDWDSYLEKGFLPGSRRPAFLPLSPRPGFDPAGYHRIPEQGEEGDAALVFRPDPHLHDGRFRLHPWLQELPHPLTEICWGSALLLDPERAEKMKVENGQVVEVVCLGKKLEAPAWIHPGHCKDTVTLSFGQNGSLGTDAYRIWPGSRPDWAPARLRATAKKIELVSAQEHSRIDEKHPIRFVRNGQPLPRPEHEPVSLYREDPGQKGLHSWGMVIDLSRCIGCKACVLACQAENNIPTVGKQEVANSREMHWIRVDRYFSGSPENPEIHFQPVPCMHCEKAPCEPVCPVGATLHNQDGLNQMIYNRCVGTRYCSNNCPYKVRRFNFHGYNEGLTPVEKLGKNPDLSVRPRGVMEKCTYCVQRIQRKGIEAGLEGRKTGGDEVVTSCQAACPTEAIVFGDLKQKESKVSAWKSDPLNYALLGELGTRPRTTYLAKVVQGEIK